MKYLYMTCLNKQCNSIIAYTEDDKFITCKKCRYSTRRSVCNVKEIKMIED